MGLFKRSGGGERYEYENLHVKNITRLDIEIIIFTSKTEIKFNMTPNFPVATLEIFLFK